MQCGGKYSASSGHFTSPGYPIGYTNNLNCEYKIESRPMDYVTIEFEDPFEIEPGTYI